MKQSTSSLSSVHSVMEVPIMDDRKWAKIPHIAADAFFVDLEDSAPQALKSEARARAVDLVGDPAHLGGRRLIARVNNLETDWGHEDLVAMAEAGAEVVTYPKVRSAGELEAAQHVLRAHGSDPLLCAVIECAKGVVNVNEIARVDRLAGLFFGPSDLALDAGMDLFGDDGMVSAPIDTARTGMVYAAAARRVATYDALFVRDMRNADDVRASVMKSRSHGFTGVLTFYPPHIDVINDAYAVDEDAVARARRVVSAYEEAMVAGQTAVLLDGEALIIQDYKRARALLGAPV